MSKFNSGFPDNDEVSDELYLLRLRNWRNKQLADTDWTQVLDTPVDKSVWATYRQALRDLPTNNADPRKIDLPIKPV
jgi:hypothetical protein